MGAAPAQASAACQALERTVLATGVRAQLFRDEHPAAAFSEGQARQARYLLHARLQSAVDQPRWLYLAGSAARRSADRHACRPDADLERVSVVGGLCAADGTRLRAARPDEPGNARGSVDRVPSAGAARGAGKVGQESQPYV